MKKRVTAAIFCTVYVLSATNAFAKRGEVKSVLVEPAVKAEEAEIENAVTEEAEIIEDTVQPSEYVLSLQDAIAMAKADSLKFSSLDVKKSDAQFQLEQARKNQRDSKGAIKLPAQIDVAALRRGYYVNQAEINLKSADMEKVQAESQLAYDVTQKYFNVKYIEKMLECTKNSLDLVTENKNIIDTQFSLGLVAELDVKNADISVVRSNYAYASLERNLDVAIEDLKIALQIQNSDCKLILTDDIEFSDYSSVVEDDISKAMENRYDLYTLKSTYDQSLLYRSVMELLGTHSSQYSAANKNAALCEYNYTNSKKLVGLAIKNCYNSIITAKENIDITNRQLELYKQEYTAAKLKFELGLITNIELTNIMNNIDQTQAQLEKNKLDYKLAIEKYKYEISIGL